MSKLPFKKVAWITPAGTASDCGAKAGVDFLHANNVEVKVFGPLYKGGYPDISPEERAVCFMEAYIDNSCDVILAARGGFGCVHLLEFIDWYGLSKFPNKKVIGYSDITALHFGMLANNIGTPIAGIMGLKLQEYFSDNLEKEAYFSAINNNFYEISNDKYDVLFEGECTGLPICGNLAVAVSLCGTKYFPNFKDKIVILEDINEPLYKIDRYLMQLKMNNVFEDCAGVIFGHFTSNSLDKKLLHELFLSYANEFKIPTIINFPFGHEKPFVSINMSRKIKILKDKIIL